MLKEKTVLENIDGQLFKINIIEPENPEHIELEKNNVK